MKEIALHTPDLNMLRNIQVENPKKQFRFVKMDRMNQSAQSTCSKLEM